MTLRSNLTDAQKASVEGLKRRIRAIQDNGGFSTEFAPSELPAYAADVLRAEGYKVQYHDIHPEEMPWWTVSW